MLSTRRERRVVTHPRSPRLVWAVIDICCVENSRPTRARSPPYAPFCSDGIGLSVLPGALRLLGLAPVGCRRLTRSRVNVLAGRFILDAGCVVSAPLPAL